MAKPKVKVPTDEEKQLLWDLMYDSCLFQCHGIVVNNVSKGVEQLLNALGRPDLAALWAEPDALNRCSGPRQP